MTPIELLMRIGWLHQSAVDRWRQGRVDFLEDVISANLARERVRPLVEGVLETWRRPPEPSART